MFVVEVFTKEISSSIQETLFRKGYEWSQYKQVVKFTEQRYIGFSNCNGIKNIFYRKDILGIQDYDKISIEQFFEMFPDNTIKFVGKEIIVTDTELKYVTLTESRSKVVTALSNIFDIELGGHPLELSGEFKLGCFTGTIYELYSLYLALKAKDDQ